VTEHVDEAMAYMAHAGAEVAEAWLARLLERVDALQRFPDAGRRLPEFDRNDLRELIVGPYRVVYRRRPTVVDILGVHHHARDRLRAVVEGLADLEAGGELDLTEVKRQLELD
jgi:plasmid stabilization system protein ParE